MDKKQITSVDEYIKSKPQAVQEILNRIRTIITDTALEATESISYDIPTYSLPNNKHFLFFAGWKNHVSLYPIYGEGDSLKEKLKAYKKEKDTLQFPLSSEIPYDLIKEVVLMKLSEQ